MWNNFRLFVLVATFVAFPTISIAQSDTTPPTLRTLCFGASPGCSQTSVNVTAGAQTLPISASITDDISGVSFATIQFTSPSGQIVSAGLSRVSGNDLAGSYSTTATFPQAAQAGTWTVSVTLGDNAGNRITLQSATVVNLGFPGTLSVVDTAPDTTPPTLLSVSFSPSTIDTSNGPVPVTISIGASDFQSGVSFNQFEFALTISPQGAGGSGPVQYVDAIDFRLASGTPQNGVWQVTKIMPQYSGGNWVLNQVTLYDAVSNHITLTPAQLAAMSINPVLSVTSAQTDSTPPSLTGLSLAPSVIDTSASAQNVTVTVSANDDISGVDFTPATPNLAAYFHLYFFSPSGGQFAEVSPYAIPPLVAGTPLAGTWQLTAPWPQFSEEGTWTMAGIALQDKVGNFRGYSTAQLQQMGFPTNVVVTKPSLTPDGTIGPAGGTVNDNSFGTRASITFPPGLVSTSTSVSIDVFPSPLAVPTPRGFTMPGTYFENISFSPTLSEPIPTPGITIVLPLLTPMTPGAHLSLYHIDPIVGLSPAMNSFGNPVVGIVNADEASATFNNVVTFSTVVAYLSNGSVLGDVNGDGKVNCADVSILKSSFGKTTGQVGYNLAADLNNDGTVNVLDLFIISRQLPAGTVCQ
jgi:hypothetical protein